jgi:hypothetical protein
MVIIDNRTFSIYNRQDLDPKTLKPLGNKKITWVPDEDRQFKTFPNLLQANVKANFLFDPTFTYFVSCDYQKGCFVIVQTTGVHYKDIPNDLISIISQEDGKKSTSVVTKKASHMVFKSKDILEYITSDGLWVMLYIHDENGKHNEMRVKRYSQIKNW